MKEKRRNLTFFSPPKTFLLQQVILLHQVWRVWFCFQPLLELCMLWEKTLSSTMNTTAFRVLISHNVLKTLPRIYYRIWVVNAAWPNGYSLCFFSHIYRCCTGRCLRERNPITWTKPTSKASFILIPNTESCFFNSTPVLWPKNVKLLRGALLIFLIKKSEDKQVWGLG